MLAEPVERVGEAQQRVAGGIVTGAGGAAQAQVDPARVQRLEGPELLRDVQRRVVGQHDAAGAHPQPAGAVRDVTDEDLRGGEGHVAYPVVLGHPEPGVADLLGQPGELDRVADGLRRAGLRGDRALVDDGEGDHHNAFASGRRVATSGIGSP